MKLTNFDTGPCSRNPNRTGNGNQFMGDVGAAKNAGVNLFDIIESEDELQAAQRNHCKNLKPANVQGHIEFRNVSFKYPSRDQVIFSNFSLKINAGHKAAIVGPSGCGKSTIIQLLQRFYEIDSGEILLDGINIKDYDVHYLRSLFGVVSQEPVLFNGTIKQNI